MEQKRTRIKVNTTMIGSSDFRRVKAVRAILTENHEKNVSFFAAIKATEMEEKKPTTEREILTMYANVFVLGRWCPVNKFVGSLVFMYDSNFKFK